MVPSVILCDLGGTYLRLAVGTRCGAIYHLVRTRLTETLTDRPDATWNHLSDSIKAYSKRMALPKLPTVLAFPGPIGQDGTPVMAPTLCGTSRHMPSKMDLERLIGGKVYLLNDVSAAAWQLGLSTQTRGIVVTVSSGIGAKVFDSGHSAFVIDSPEICGEIGHIIVDHSPSAPICDCGGLGHLGAIASGRGIERGARKRARDFPTDFVQSICAMEYGAKPDTLNNERHLIPAAARGDKWAMRVICDHTEPLARVLAVIYVTLGLSRIFIMGGFAQALGPVYQELLQQTVVDSLGINSVQTRGVIRVVDEHDEVGVRGCLAYYLKTVQGTT